MIPTRAIVHIYQGNAPMGWKASRETRAEEIPALLLMKFR